MESGRVVCLERAGMGGFYFVFYVCQSYVRGGEWHLKLIVPVCSGGGGRLCRGGELRRPGPPAASQPARAIQHTRQHRPVIGHSCQLSLLALVTQPRLVISVYIVCQAQYCNSPCVPHRVNGPFSLNFTGEHLGHSPVSLPSQPRHTQSARVYILPNEG